MSNHAIQVKNIRKQFSYSNHKNSSLKSAITQVFKPKDTSVNSFYALDDISFNVEKGDFFGILGRNGSGKSTLLKIISEIYQPTSGDVKHDGKLVSFIELGVGFKSELTGKENVYLNGGLLGFSKSEVDDMYDEVVGFAELEDFMDQQLKNYSSGMKVRLAFSVAIRAKADVLILDEVLAVGDASFQKKCTDYFETLKENGKTVILVTHSMGNVRRFCNKAVVIDDGKVVFEGGADEAADTYLALFDVSSDKNSNTPNLSNGVKLIDLDIIQGSAKTSLVRFKDDFKLGISLQSDSEFNDISMGIQVVDMSGRVIFSISSQSFGGYKLKNGLNNLELGVQNILKDGDYFINIAIEDSMTKRLLIQKHKVTRFRVNGLLETGYSVHGLVYPDVEVV